MIRLGLRLALADGRRSALTVGLTALAVAIGTAILLFAVSFLPAAQTRDARAAWRQLPDVGGTAPTVLMQTRDERYRDVELVRVLVAATAPAPAVPPGIARLPGPGEAFVSPALADLVAAHPDELAGRVGRIAGTIAPDALRSPDELVAVVGVERAVLEGQGAPIDAFRTIPATPDVPPSGMLILVLAAVGALVPVVVFVATATRLSAAGREQRLAALRLIGATPAQVARLAVAEALLFTATGAPAGVLLFFLARPLVALIPLDGTGWYPDTIAPPLAAAAVVLIAVQLAGAAAATVSMRRLAISPLGVRQRVSTRPPRARRLAPIALGVASLLGGIVVLRDGGLSSPGPLVFLAASFALVIGGIAIAGPWLTALVGRILARVARGSASLLAARRLTDDPAGSFGAIAGVIMAVFVAGVFASFGAYAVEQAAPGHGARADEVTAGLAGADPGALPSGSTFDARLLVVAGVRDVLAVPEAVVVDASGSHHRAWIVPCARVARYLGMAEGACSAAAIHLLTPEPLHGPAVVSRFDDGSGGPPLGSFSLASATTGRLEAPRDADPTFLPDVIVEPAALGAAAASFAVGTVYVRTDGSTSAAERARAGLEALAPAAWVTAPGDPQFGGKRQFAEIDRIVQLGLFGTLVLAGCSLAIAVVTGLLQRRRQFALLRAAGMPLGRLRALILLQAGVPLVAVSAVSGLLGVGIGQAVLQMLRAGSVPAPDWSIAPVVGLSLVAAMLVVGLTLPIADRLTRVEALRVE